MEQVFRTIIVDDEESAIDNLCFELRRYVYVSVEGTARTGATGLKLIEKVKPDLLFLDVELPDMSGMDVVARLRDRISWDMRMVFYTAYNKYIIDALRSSAFDFLQKPVDSDELQLIMSRLCGQGNKGDVSKLETVFAGRPFMLVTPTGDLRFVHASEIGFFRYLSNRKLWEVALTDGTFLPLRRNTTAEQLCAYDSVFVQIHQSFIINMHYLIMVQDNRCIMYPPFNAVEDLIVSKKYKKKMQERFYQL